MQIVNLPQGSAEWLAHRSKHLNASDAPAMMGCSPYKTRSQLLKEMATGMSAEVNAATQRRFDEGHRFEALARPMAEKIAGEEFYPCVGVLGRFSASFDGLTIDESIAFEHKTLNDTLRGCMLPHSTGLDLPLVYRAQMEHQLMVSGAGRVLFMATRWAEDGTLLEERHTWYFADPDLRQALIAGWEQLEKDVANYRPAPSTEPAKAEAVESLPAVSVRLDGSLSVAGNLPTFYEALKAFIAKIPAKPATDNDFATVDAACKALKKAEEALDSAEQNALASITDVESMRRAVADCRKLARDTRLAAEKLVERRKVEMKEQAVMAARRALQEHVDALSAELAPIRLQAPAVDFALAIKGLRSIASMQDALDNELAGGKIAADVKARLIRSNRAAMESSDAAHLFPDFASVCTKSTDDFSNLIASRMAADQQRAELERERIRTEEAARLEREAAEKSRAEAAANDAAAHDEQRVDPVSDTAAMMKATPISGWGVQSIGMATRTAGDVSQVESRTAGDAPTLKLGEINARLGYTVTAEFLAMQGFQAVQERNAKLYRESDFTAICEAIAAYTLTVPRRQKVAA